MIFKTVPHAKEYEMSVEGHVRRKDGLECKLTHVNEQPMITLVIYGSERTVAIEWLRLMTHFEVDLRYRDFWNIYFVPIKLWHKCNTVHRTMLFDGCRPEYKPGYRYVPEFTRYAISNTSVLIDTYTTEIVTHNVETGRYITVHCYDPDRGKFRELKLHRLVALAWVRNPDHLKYYLVNHKNGDKHDPTSTNLEWTDHKGNVDHAYKFGLRSQNIDCKVRNVSTGEITIFSSLSEACLYMGIKPRSYDEFIRFNTERLISGKYQIKLVDDLSDWDLTKESITNSSARLKITITDNTTDTVKVVYGLKELYRYLGLIDNSCKKIDVALVYAKRNNLTIEYVDQYKPKLVNVPIQVYVVKTNKILEYKSIKQAANDLQINPSTIRHTLSKGETFVTNGYAYRYKINKKWNTNFSEAINRPKCILAIHKDGREIKCDSSRIAERLTKVNRMAILRNLRGASIPFDWYFKYIYKQ